MRRGRKVGIYDPGHMTKMAATKTFKNLQNQKSDLETWNGAWGQQLYKVFINDDHNLFYDSQIRSSGCV